MENLMKPENTYKLIIASLAIFVVLACNGTFTTGFSTPTIPPAPPTTPPTPVSQPFVISTLNFNETGENAEYTIKAQIPTISDNTDPHALAFNSEMQTIVQGQINEFKGAVSEMTPNPVGPYTLDAKYNLLFQNGAIASIKFEIQGYTGGAHPYLNIMTVNYDLAQSRQVALSELFLPNSNYLDVIANYCIAELRKQPVGSDPVFSKGAAPLPENYDGWNITPDGLLITFDAYQVAPGASGPVKILIPYSELQTVINPQGPLAGVIP
jgi:hypothetical protein